MQLQMKVSRRSGSSACGRSLRDRASPSMLLGSNDSFPAMSSASQSPPVRPKRSDARDAYMPRSGRSAVPQQYSNGIERRSPSDLDLIPSTPLHAPTLGMP